jgi:hypothetical protein
MYISTVAVNGVLKVVVAIPEAEMRLSGTLQEGAFLVGDEVEVGWTSIDGGQSFTSAAVPLALHDFKLAHDTYLNAPAKAKNYDSIQTAALRAGYPGPYHDEGVLFATWMDTCNELGYAIMAEVAAGTRPMFATTSEYTALLPACPVV